MPVRLVEYFSTLSDFQLERRRPSALKDILLKAVFGTYEVDPKNWTAG